MKNKFIVGSLELCDLPDIGITDLQIRVDTGAKTSSLHVDNLTEFKVKGRPWVRFDIHPNVHNVEETITCESALRDIRTIKSSNGTSEERYVIKTTLKLGAESWPIKINLTDRSGMSNLMLLGREAMKNRIIVDPSETFILSDENDT